jgi:hypothetical protein
VVWLDASGKVQGRLFPVSDRTVALCQAMRSHPGDVVSKDDLARVLFGAPVGALPESDKSG